MTANSMQKRTIGLIMSGGGARAAYQVGVLKAIAEILPPGTPNPFRVICGTSAGAINATALAIYAQDFDQAVRRLNFVWKNFRVHQVFRSDVLGVMSTGLRWIAASLLGGLGRRNPQALLDRAPLRRLLETYLPCPKIQDAVDAGYVDALSITASGYGSGESISFFQGVDTISPWKRARRIGAAARITIDHLMASSAIPVLFGAVKINREYFGDGSMRQIAPISPALHLGAERVLVIGVRQDQNARPPRAESDAYPTLAEIGGHVLNSIFLDSMEADIERLERINRTVSLLSAQQIEEGGVTLRKVDVLVIAPSQDIGKIAAKHAHHLPRPVRFLLRGLGASARTGANLISYLLFEKPYCRELIALGYGDALKRKDEILAFLGREPKVTSVPRAAN
jgi:NTE family protein